MPLVSSPDKSAGGKFETDFEDASDKLQDYQESVGIEVQERNNLLTMLHQCKTHHEKKTRELKDLLKVRTNLNPYTIIINSFSIFTDHAHTGLRQYLQSLAAGKATTA